MDLHTLAQSLKFELRQPYFLVTYHPVTSGEEEPESSFQTILDALDEYPEHQIILTYPNADDGGRRIIPLLEAYAALHPSRVIALESLGQVRYLSAIKFACAVIGNSSSGIIEVPAFDVPTVNIGVRQQGRLASRSVLHCHAIKADIVSAMNVAVTRCYKTESEAIENPYGQGNASCQVIDMLKTLNIASTKTFYDLKVTD